MNKKIEYVMVNINKSYNKISLLNDEMKEYKDYSNLKDAIKEVRKERSFYRKDFNSKMDILVILLNIEYKIKNFGSSVENSLHNQYLKLFKELKKEYNF